MLSIRDGILIHAVLLPVRWDNVWFTLRVFTAKASPSETHQTRK